MRGVFTREERAVVLFLTLSLLVGSAIVRAGRVFPSVVPDFGSIKAAEADAPEEAPPPGPVDVNSAGADELVRLPGIGPVRAAGILRLRDELGGFATLEQLLEVRGIGPVTLEKLRPEAVVGTARSAADTNAARADTVDQPVGPTAAPQAPADAGARKRSGGDGRHRGP